MSPETAQIALKAFTARKPFRPYIIELMDARAIEVLHPEVVRARAGAFVFVSPEWKNILFDSSSIVCRRDR